MRGQDIWMSALDPFSVPVLAIGSLSPCNSGDSTTHDSGFKALADTTEALHRD